MTDPINGVAGAEAKLENQSLNICTSATDDNRSNAIWVGIDDNGGHKYDVIQVGIGKCKQSANPDCDATTNQWMAWGRSHTVSGCAGFMDVKPVPAFLGDFPGGTWPYTVVRTSQQWKVQINGVTQQTIPLSSICWSKRRADWLGESWDIGDAIGGSSSDKFRVSSAIYEGSVGGVWTSESWTLGNTCNNMNLDPRWKCNVVSGSALDLWTVQP